MKRIRAAWAAFRNPDEYVIDVHHDRVVLHQKAVTKEMARAIKTALSQLERKNGRHA